MPKLSEARRVVAAAEREILSAIERESRTTRARVLVVDAEASARAHLLQALAHAFGEQACEAHGVTSAAEALRLDCADLWLACARVELEDVDGVDLAPRLAALHPDAEIVLYSCLPRDRDIVRAHAFGVRRLVRTDDLASLIPALACLARAYRRDVWPRLHLQRELARRVSEQLGPRAAVRLGLPSAIAPASADPRVPLRGNRAEVELALAQRVLAHAGGNISEAARELGVSRHWLYRRLHGGMRSVPARLTSPGV